MPQITFLKSGKTVQVSQGENLMKAVLAAGLPVASSCDGDGVCGKCHLKIISGAQNLSKETQEEQELREIHEVPKTSRISCQATVNGDLVIDTSYW